MANQRLYAYLDSCDPACEDCDCEDPEHPTDIVFPGEEDGESDEQKCDCKCHNIPHDPREDGD